VFKAECKEESDHNVHLSIVQDGHHWTAITIKNPEHEIPLIISALVRYLADHLAQLKGVGHSKHL